MNELAELRLTPADASLDWPELTGIVIGAADTAETSCVSVRWADGKLSVAPDSPVAERAFVVGMHFLEMVISAKSRLLIYSNPKLAPRLAAVEAHAKRIAAAS